MRREAQASAIFSVMSASAAGGVGSLAVAAPPLPSPPGCDRTTPTSAVGDAARAAAPRPAGDVDAGGSDMLVRVLAGCAGGAAAAAAAGGGVCASSRRRSASHASHSLHTRVRGASACVRARRGRGGDEHEQTDKEKGQRRKGAPVCLLQHLVRGVPQLPERHKRVAAAAALFQQRVQHGRRPSARVVGRPAQLERHQVRTPADRGRNRAFHRALAFRVFSAPPTRARWGVMPGGGRA